MERRTPKYAARLLVAKNIRTLRLRLGISQERLGELAGLHRTYVSAVEAGRRNITIDSMERFAVALGVDLKILLIQEDYNEITS